MSKSTELQLYMHRETMDHWILSETGEEQDARAYNKKFVDRGERVSRKEPIYEFTFPMWLAEKEGLV